MVDWGGFGVILQGDLGGRGVALKIVRTRRRGDTYDGFKVCIFLNEAHYLTVISSWQAISREAVLWRQVAHPNVLPFYGVFDWDDGSGPLRTCLVSPWMGNGNIVEYLELHPDSDRWCLVSNHFIP